MFTEVERFNCDAVSLAETLRGCNAVWIEFPEGGGAHVAWREASPGVIELTAAQGQAGKGSVLKWLPWLELSIKARAVQLVTQRRGLIRELGKRGYTVAGVILRKELPHGRQFQS